MIDNKITDYKIAFIGWNPFQFIQIRDLASALPGSVFVIEKKKNNNIEAFSEEILNNTDVPILIWEQSDLIKLDDIFDIIVAQTVFTHIHMFKKAKLVMLQYGYAKEPHNYGSWRALADLCLTFGDYSADKISHFSPVEAIGNPRYDLWNKEEFHSSVKEKYAGSLNKSIKTILYMPTWGDLSSVDLYMNSILSLSSKYNLLIKVHHNTDILEKNRVTMKNSKQIHFFGANTDALDLLSLADIVISDYSGAIFDAIYCDKPVILCDIPVKHLLELEKIDEHSLEFSNRDDLGYRINNPEQLESAINTIEVTYDEIISKKQIIKNKLFQRGNYSIQRGVDALNGLMEGIYIRTQMQHYIHETVKEHHTTKRLYNILKKKVQK